MYLLIPMMLQSSVTGSQADHMTHDRSALILLSVEHSECQLMKEIKLEEIKMDVYFFFAGPSQGDFFSYFCSSKIRKKWRMFWNIVSFYNRSLWQVKRFFGLLTCLWYAEHRWCSMSRAAFTCNIVIIYT